MIAEQIGNAAQARIARVTQANGYETGLGLLPLFRGKRNISDQDMPCVVLVEGSDNLADDNGNAPEGLMSFDIMVQAFVACDPDHPNVAAHAALRDIKRTLFRSGSRVSVGWTEVDGVQTVRYQSADIAPRLDGKPFVLAAVHITVLAYENLAD